MLVLFQKNYLDGKTRILLKNQLLNSYFLIRYTETDSRPLTPAPTIASNYTKASTSRRCVTPDPITTSQFKEKTQLILDLRRSHSQVKS